MWQKSSLADEPVCGCGSSRAVSSGAFRRIDPSLIAWTDSRLLIKAARDSPHEEKKKTGGHCYILKRVVTRIQKPSFTTL
jgi:hypothetical protein